MRSVTPCSALVALLLLVTSTALAQQPTGSAVATPPSSARVCALPFTGAPTTAPDLGYRFWVGLVDQLAAQPEITSVRNGVLAVVAGETKKACADLTDADLGAITSVAVVGGKPSAPVDWILTGRLSVEGDGSVIAIGVGYRRSDKSIVRTPRYRIGPGEESKAVAEMAAYMMRFVTAAAVQPVPPRQPSVEQSIAAMARSLDEQTRTGLAGDEIVGSVATFLDGVAAPAAFPTLEDVLRGVLVGKPDHVGGIVQLGRLHLLRGAPSDAQAAFTRALETAKNAPEAYDLCAYACLRAKQLDVALAYANAGVATAPTHPSLNNTLGLIHMAKQQPADAEAAFRRAVQGDPTGTTGTSARLNLAVLLLSTGRADNALEVLNEALAVAPDNPDLHYNRGLALHVVGRRDSAPEKLAEARQEYEKTISLDPSHPKAHCNLGVLLEAEGQQAEAIAAYQKALELDPAFVTAGRNLASAYERLGDKAAAAAAWRAVAAMPGVSAEDARQAQDRANQLGG